MTYHLEIRIERALSMSDAMLKSMFGGSAKKTREDLEARKEKGEILIGPADCKEFDPITGCPGHEVTEEET